MAKQAATTTTKPSFPCVLLSLLSVGVLWTLSACGSSSTGLSEWSFEYDVVEPGTHPGIVFSERELPALRKRAAGDGIAATAYRKLKAMAKQPADPELTIEQAVGRDGVALARQLEAMALVYQVEQDRATGRRAVDLFQAIATGIDPIEYYREVEGDFFATEHWPKAFAYSWDWLYELMTADEREKVLRGLEEWNSALFDHTESWWWREAHWNCGAIPTGAQGLLLTAIQAETTHPDHGHWFSECFRKVNENYFQSTWRPSGINREGPGYAHYHKNPTHFAEAVRRTGGLDVIPDSRAVRAMRYMRHQWMPQGGCGPLGDNTNYGRRVFQSIYLHGIRERADRAGLWTFENHTDFDRINPLPIFLYYPDGLEPVSPGTLDLRTSAYFEVDEHLAGILFSRSEWDAERAHWFAAGIRHTDANHTHYDMNSFLFTAFGEQFATHENVYGYGHPHHGVDFEHNIVIIDDGGMPAADRQNSAGDDGSIDGDTTGLALGHFADYIRGDAHLSYKDRSIPSSTPAIRADRALLFVKQGPNPYVVVADDIQKDDREHDYHWQWYTQAKSIQGKGTFTEPFQIDAEHSHCRIAFLEPEAPAHDFQVVQGDSHRRPVELGLLRVHRTGVQARFFAVGAAWRTGVPPPRLSRGPEVHGTEDAASLVVEGEGFRDLIVWQPKASRDSPRIVSAGELKTDAEMALVRTDSEGRVTGYLAAEGTSLEFAGRTLMHSERPFSVSADSKRSIATGARRPKQGLAPLPPAGSFWLPNATSEVWVDEERHSPPVDPEWIVTLPATAGS